MIGTRATKYDKIKGQLEPGDNITIISCNTCVRLATTGGEEKMKELALKLRGEGFNVIDGFLITYPCDDSYYENIRLSPNVNTIIMLSCSSGYANAQYHYPDVKIIQAVENRGVVINEIVIEDDGTERKKKNIRRVKV